VPEIFRVRGFRFFFYSNEGSPREPVHVHVEKNWSEAKFWIYPEVILAYNDGYDARTIREIQSIIESRKQEIGRAWNEFFG
jgi:Domain of unknown function (DUF4160)